MTWIKEAARELASHFSFGVGRDSYVTEEQRTAVTNYYADIIAKHTPRCETCKQWLPKAKPEYVWSTCELLSAGTVVSTEDDEVLQTKADFGCIKWEAK